MHKFFPLILACLAPTAAMAGSRDVEAPVMPVSTAVSAPAGYLEMCRRHPGECLPGAAPQTAEAHVSASQARWAEIFGQSGRRAMAPSSTTPAPATIGTSTPRLAMPSRSWMLVADDAYPRDPAEHQPRPFFTNRAVVASRFEPAARVMRPLPVSLTVPTLPALPLPAPVLTPETAFRIEQEPTVAPLPVMGQLRAVNALVNRSIRRASDVETFGRNDFWATPADGATGGDCEDYVLAKRHALIEAGIQPQSLSIALVRTRQGEMHAVLLVATEQGEMVLDNLSPWILAWNDAPYTWVARQVAGSSDWVRVSQIG